MAWTTPAARAVKALITAAIWNTDLVANLNYLHDNLLYIGGGAQPTLQTFTSVPTAGASSGLFTYTESGILFPNACVAVWQGGVLNYSDSGHTTSVTTSDFQWAVVPSGANVAVTFNNLNGATRYPRLFLVAVGY